MLVDALVAGGELEPDGGPAHSMGCSSWRSSVCTIDAIVIKAPGPESGTGGWRVDFRPFVSSLNLLYRLATNLAKKADAEFEDVIIDLRQHLYGGAAEST